ncbi:nuclear transport factor 2 family protein [Sphingorhabdus sp. SMR4y]|uniref:nuclear transport factor 2 family protein n=1 Tax=Sphingorhabdus sp. SMR4y TaxID=2584094 RepID=UPI000B5C9C4A|nr:nuclear transport factor 2 family protein [Sphingorhabdus sp. SMR4y]ASK89455.1 SnoaL-like domain protein [Sphingorhabdus sp. SMR4y]
MAQAKELIETFWELQNDNDYSKLIPLFANDAVFEDPAIGRVEGIAAISALLHRLTKELADKKMHFEVLEIAGDEHVAWSRWLWKRPDGDIEGVGLYRVADGQLTSYRDCYAVPES